MKTRQKSISSGQDSAIIWLLKKYSYYDSYHILSTCPYNTPHQCWGHIWAWEEQEGTMEHSDQKCGASMINTKQHYSLHGSVQVIFGIRLLMVSKKISFELEGAMGLRTTKVRTKKRSGLQGKKNGEPPLSLVIKIMKFSYRMFAIMSYRGITIILTGLIMGSLRSYCQVLSWDRSSPAGSHSSSSTASPRSARSVRPTKRGSPSVSSASSL